MIGQKHSQVDGVPLEPADAVDVEGDAPADLLTALSKRVEAAEPLVQRGLLAASIGHELNNALTAVLGNLECVAATLAELDDPRAREARDVLADAVDAGRGATALAHQLHAGATPTSNATATVDVRAVVRSTVRLARPRLGRRARLQESYAADVPSIAIDPQPISQIVLNLLFNAEEALPREAASNCIGIDVATDASGRPVIAVSDSGRGMDAATARRIFEPFFTRRATGDGSGLGLYLCRQLVSRLGGTIEVETEPERGTVFFVTLPTDAPAPDANDAAAARSGAH